MLGALSASEIKYIIDGISQNVRADGRGRFDFRPFRLETGLISQANGSSKFVIGKTTVLVGVKVALTEPKPETPDCGSVEVTVDCCPSASPEYEGRGAEDLNIKLASAVETLMLSSDYIDLKSLCLIPKRQCWMLYIDAMVLDSGGNLFDAISIATRAALANTTLPKVRVIESGKSGEYELELMDDPEDCIHINVDHVPIFITFNHFGQYFIVDPTIEEELCFGCRTTIGVNKYGKICSIDMGSGTIKLDCMPDMSLAATKIGAEIIQRTDQIIESEHTDSDGTKFKAAVRGFLRA